MNREHFLDMDMDWLDDDVHVPNIRRSYQQRMRATINEWDDYEFFVRFRMTKPTFNMVLQLITPTLQHPQPRSRYLTPEQQLLITLRFLASGSMQLVVADFVHASQPTVSRVLVRVCDALLLHFRTFIKMPETNAEREQAAAEFYRIAEFPRTIGAIDCTHIKVQSPGGNLVCVLFMCGCRQQNLFSF